MATQIWPKIKGIVIVGGTVSIITYKINFDVCYADVPTYTVPKSGIQWNNNWDNREPDPMTKPVESGDCPGFRRKTKQRPTTKRNIFLIRHGDYIHESDGGLTELGLYDAHFCLKCTQFCQLRTGIAQAEFTGIKLCEMGFKFNVIIHSTMRRAHETASIINDYVPGSVMVPTPALREGAPIQPVPSMSYKPENWRLKADGERLEEAFKMYFHRADWWQKFDTYEVMVCHANVIRFFICRAMQFPPEAWLRFSLKNCSISWLVIHPNGRVELKSSGDCGHIPSRLLTC